jgi:hypothetical protein
MFTVSADQTGISNNEPEQLIRVPEDGLDFSRGRNSLLNVGSVQDTHIVM